MEINDYVLVAVIASLTLAWLIALHQVKVHKRAALDAWRESRRLRRELFEVCTDVAIADDSKSEAEMIRHKMIQGDQSLRQYRDVAVADRRDIRLKVNDTVFV
jgi:hypothetical protein